MKVENSILEERSRTRPWEYGVATATVAVCTLVALLLRPHAAAANLVMVYLLGVVGVAATLQRRVAIFTSVLSVAAFDFFCVPPYLTFAVSDYEYLITFAVMLVVALAISAMTSRIRIQAMAIAGREAQTKALYGLSQELVGQTRVFDILRTAARSAERTFGGKITVFLPDEARKVSFNRRTSDQLLVPSAEQGIAQWVFDRGEKAGKGTSTLPGASALYIPLKGASETFGVMAVVPDSREEMLSPERQSLLEVFASQTALAIERNIASSAARDAEVRVETESLRTSLLSAVSHDLRTPLSSITAAAATLRTHWGQLDDKTRDELLESVTDEADRLNRLLNNLLEVTRLEAGVHLHKELCPLEEVVGAALHRLSRQLADRTVRTDFPASLPLVAIDDVLMEQVFVNLIENAVKYTPVDSPIEITAVHRGEVLEVEVGDRGPGIPKGKETRIFEKFFRGRTDSVRGAGLGLAICRAIVEAHEGSIEALNRVGGGALFRLQLPLAHSTSTSQPVGRNRLG
jgi:two-component system sensor histidine kinase KdpD